MNQQQIIKAQEIALLAIKFELIGRLPESEIEDVLAQAWKNLERGHKKLTRV